MSPPFGGLFFVPESQKVQISETQALVACHYVSFVTAFSQIDAA